MEISQSPWRDFALLVAWATVVGLVWSAGVRAETCRPELEPAWRVDPVLGNGRLADVALEFSEEAKPVDVVVQWRAGGDSGRAMLAPGPVVGGADGGEFVARLLLPSGTGIDSLEFRWVEGARERRLGPVTPHAARQARTAPPEWAAGVVWYQVFPERFRNGNPANDPRGPEVFQPSWKAPWERVTVAEVEAAMARSPSGRRFVPDRPGGLLYNVVWNRRYGGDLQGLVEKLDHLVELGVTGIYLNPIFDAASLHKYDARDHRHIDPTLGHPGDPYDGPWAPAGETDDPSTWGWTAADRYFVDVVLPECRRRGLRVVLDGVWNHVGRDHWAFRDVARRGSSSRYADWFDARFGPSGELVGWSGWDGRNGRLPEFRQTSRGDLVAPVKEHVYAVTRRWMDPNGDGDPSDGIDGWRLDVVPDVGLAFWRDWCSYVRELNSEAVLIAEVWHRADRYLDGKSFDAQMNYPFASAVVRWLDGRTSFTSEHLGRALARAGELGDTVNLAQMNLVDSHDTERLVSMLANPGREYSDGGKLHHGASGYDRTRPEARAYDLAEIAVALQVCWPGSATVYYGDEFGMHGANDPDCRKPLPWPELGPYDEEVGPVEGHRDRYREWLGLARDERYGNILRFGLTRILPTGHPSVFAFERRLGDARLVLVANRGPRAWVVDNLAPGVKGEVEARSARLWLPGD